MKKDAFKYKLVGGKFAYPQYFNHIDVLSRRIDVSVSTIKKAIKENDGKFKDYQVFLSDDFVFNDFEQGDHIEVDGLLLEVVSVEYERVIAVKHERFGTGLVNLKTMKLVSGLIFESESRERRRQNTKNFVGG